MDRNHWSSVQPPMVGKGHILRQLPQLVGFALAGPNYAVSLAAVERIVHVVEIAPLPQAPEIVLGVINFSGRIIPVVDMRKRFRLPAKEVGIYDLLIIARTSKREIAFIADGVAGVLECPEADITAAEEIVPGLEYLAGVLKLKDGLIFIHDLERFLSLDEERSLDEAMQGL
ncbi:MAG: chemotaxis protein CheW [Methanoregulaceae archaeon]|nr:chemotaxis protein CheW [Methanoregulaceae archaeon]